MPAQKFKYLIIGNSAGAVGAAEAIRETDAEGTLAVISDEPYPAYSRPLISDYLAHPCPIERLMYRKPDFYTRHGVKTYFGSKAQKINPAARTVSLADGQDIGYEKLLLATGGTPIMPGTEGMNLSHVFTFNRLDDAKAIDALIARHHRRIKAVVIGGGLIGISCTEALVKRGVDVVIIEMKDRVLNTILDAEASALEARALLAAGVTVITDHTVVRISGNLTGEVSAVTLDDGRTISCEMVVMAIGVRPRVELAGGTGIKLNRGIVVDERMETSVKGIYACGDSAEAFDFVVGENRLTPIWPNAYEGGRTAGLNMAGKAAAYAGGTAMNALKYFAVHIVSAGLPAAPDASYETLISRGQNGIYRKVILKNNRLVGLVYAGDIEKSGIVYNLMKDGADVGAYKKALVADDFGLASLPEAVWRARLSRPAGVPVKAAAAR